MSFASLIDAAEYSQIQFELAADATESVQDAEDHRNQSWHYTLGVTVIRAR